MTREQVIEALRASIEKAGGVKAWCEPAGVSVPYVYDVLANRRDPGGKLLEALGLRKVVTYEHI